MENVATYHWISPARTARERESTGKRVRPRSAKILLIDDDPFFRALINHFCRRVGVSIDCIAPQINYEELPRDGEYDVVILDYNLGPALGGINGAQLSCLFRTTPVLLVSATPLFASKNDGWPASVRHFVTKEKGPPKIIGAALAISTGEYLA